MSGKRKGGENLLGNKSKILATEPPGPSAIPNEKEKPCASYYNALEDLELKTKELPKLFKDLEAAVKKMETLEDQFFQKVEALEKTLLTNVEARKKIKLEEMKQMDEKTDHQKKLSTLLQKLVEPAASQPAGHPSDQQQFEVEELDAVAAENCSEDFHHFSILNKE